MSKIKKILYNSIMKVMARESMGVRRSARVREKMPKIGGVHVRCCRINQAHTSNRNQ